MASRAGPGYKLALFDPMLPLQPCLLERKVLPKVWGGRNLERLLGLVLPQGQQVGETWELFDRPDGSSRIRGGETTLRELVRTGGKELLGRARPGYDGHFPLLLKFVDAADALSVQVHPDDEQARVERDGGKHEAWVVLAAGPGARIVRGVKSGVTKQQLADAAGSAAIEPLLESFRPQVGDCVHVPAGTVHAIGPDVVVFEIQQNSDVTYRLYDWGRDRPVQVDKALAVARLAAAPRPVVASRLLAPGDELLIETPQFRLRRLALEQRATLATDGGFLVLNVVGGRGMLGWHSAGQHAPLLLQTGDCALVPACVPQVFVSPIGRLQALVTSPGEAA